MTTIDSKNIQAIVTAINQNGFKPGQAEALAKQIAGVKSSPVLVAQLTTALNELLKSNPETFSQIVDLMSKEGVSNEGVSDEFFTSSGLQLFRAALVGEGAAAVKVNGKVIKLDGTDDASNLKSIFENTIKTEANFTKDISIKNDEVISLVGKDAAESGQKMDAYLKAMIEIAPAKAEALSDSFIFVPNQNEIELTGNEAIKKTFGLQNGNTNDDMKIGLITWVAIPKTGVFSQFTNKLTPEDVKNINGALDSLVTAINRGNKEDIKNARIHLANLIFDIAKREGIELRGEREDYTNLDINSVRLASVFKKASEKADPSRWIMQMIYDNGEFNTYGLINGQSLTGYDSAKFPLGAALAILKGEGDIKWTSMEEIMGELNIFDPKEKIAFWDRNTSLMEFFKRKYEKKNGETEVDWKLRLFDKFCEISIRSKMLDKDDINTSYFNLRLNEKEEGESLLELFANYFATLIGDDKNIEDVFNPNDCEKMRSQRDIVVKGTDLAGDTVKLKDRKVDQKKVERLVSSKLGDITSKMGDIGTNLKALKLTGNSGNLSELAETLRNFYYQEISLKGNGSYVWNHVDNEATVADRIAAGITYLSQTSGVTEEGLKTAMQGSATRQATGSAGAGAAGQNPFNGMPVEQLDVYQQKLTEAIGKDPSYYQRIILLRECQNKILKNIKKC